MAQSLAVLGTGSDVGKTLIASGICRILKNHGIQVAPFKAQNMSNNAEPALISTSSPFDKTFSTNTGANDDDDDDDDDDHNHDQTINDSKSDNIQSWGEIGTAQAMQAEACHLLPRVEMNPILLKSGGRRLSDGAYLCNVIVLGKSLVKEDYGQLGKRTNTLMDLVLQAHKRLINLTSSQVIVIEGAGSCTELNLMDRDVVNLPLVRKLHCPWILVANIDPGGVFAQIVGTKACVSEEDWDLCVGIIVNQLKGEVKYFEPGPKMIEDMVGKPVFVVPYLYNLKVPEEDGLGVERRLVNEKHLNDRSTCCKQKEGIDAKNDKHTRVVVLCYPHIAITSDFTPLENDNRFILEWRRNEIPKVTYPTISCIILPGSRLTRFDLDWLVNETEWITYLQHFVKLGGKLIGICGGYQMLGLTVSDTKGVEGTPGTSQGLGFLPIDTEIESAECKIVKPRKGVLYGTDIQVNGFELHCGRSKICTSTSKVKGDECLSKANEKPLVQFTDLDTCSSKEEYDGLQHETILGTYIHGLFKSKKVRSVILLEENLSSIGDERIEINEENNDPLNDFANHLESSGLTFDTIQSMIGLR